MTEKKNVITHRKSPIPRLTLSNGDLLDMGCWTLQNIITVEKANWVKFPNSEHIGISHRYTRHIHPYANIGKLA